jgi:hypothetical protein
MLLMGFIISTCSAFTFLAAFNTRAKALAIIFTAFRLLACAPAKGGEWSHTLKSARVTLVCELLSAIDEMPTLQMIRTTVALASLGAYFSLGETLTIHFQAVYLCAFTARQLKLTGR